MHRRVFLESCSVIGLVNLSGTKKLLTSCYNNTDNDLATLFSNPEVRYYPQTFWFWMNGHVSKEGITLDLEAMKRAGISGVLNFDAGISIPQGPVKYLSQEWMDLKTHAIAEADRLGLTFSLHNCPGWSASGGP